MSIANTNLLNLLGKQVSFVATTKSEKRILIRKEQGIVTDVLFSLNGANEFCIDGSFYSFDKVTDFQLLN